MKILALDTSSIATSVALLNETTVSVKHEVLQFAQAELILQLVENILTEANLKLDDLDAVAFGAGPGSFTGVRIAASVAQAFGYAKKIPLIKISSLAALAQITYENKKYKKIFVAVDARMQEVYCAKYVVQDDYVELIGEELVIKPEDISKSYLNLNSENEMFFGAGSGWEVYKDTLMAKFNLKYDATLIPHARAILSLAKRKFEKDEFTAIEEAIPTYLRNEVAKKEKDR